MPLKSGGGGRQQLPPHYVPEAYIILLKMSTIATDPFRKFSLGSDPGFSLFQFKIQCVDLMTLPLEVFLASDFLLVDLKNNKSKKDLLNSISTKQKKWERWKAESFLYGIFFFFFFGGGGGGSTHF